ncbi:transmembrane 7 superfamily member 3 isoform X2 [Chiloscyllium plagiosum]|uniref:transmembrane 7 superfamily member 3 isoform X2 n=1 Tax=Chiloscyllium plagiosum TaxID=36176 RepID=UPI001CB7E041|nr:transmembrane 7 superfamily member 3 isoform X2 [Chiloscyllium plagiosum]
MPSFPRIQSPLWAAPFLLLLALSQPQTPADRIEFKLGRFQQITLFENKTFVVFLSNVPVDVTFIIIQVHTKYVNTLLSFHKITTTETSTGQDPALLQSLKPEETALMWHLRTPMENASAMSVILPYKAGDPVPGGCSMASDLTVDARVHLQYNLYEATISFAPANVGYARGTVPPLCDFAAEEPTLRLQYDVYQYFLPEADLTEKLLFASLQKMAKVDQVEANGVKLCSLGAQDKTSVTVSSIPGQGVIYNVIVKDPEMNTSAAYTPAHTYGCSFTDKLDNCYTLKRTSTRIFLVSVGLVGLFICFFGHRYLKTELFFFGFLLVGSVSFVLLTQRSALHYDVILGLVAVLGSVGGSLLVMCWWRSGSVVLCALVAGLLLGLLLSSLIFFTPLANVKVFDDDAVFWVTFSSVALLVPLIFFSCPRPLNILACGFVGSYTVILAIHNFVFTSLAYITLNIVKRALHGNFKAAFTNVPFQTNDYILISVWVVLLVSGIVFQFHREKEQPRFPPHPYKTWKRDRERRQTNILDPSHHVPPIRDRVKSALTDVKHLFTKQQSAGEQTPLLL